MRTALATFTAVGVACEVPAPTAPAVRPGLVVFGVLNPAGVEQVVLLMQSRAAVPNAAARPFAPDDPIPSTGETPVTGARVVVTSAAGDSAVLVEDRTRRADQLGAGIYRLWRTAAAASVAGAPGGAVLAVTPGQVYRLRVRAAVAGAAVAAEGTARVPSAARVVTGPARTLDLRRDSVVMPELGIQAAGFVYTLRAPNDLTLEGGPQYRRALEQRLVLPAGEDWAFAYARAAFYAGARHVLTVTATDSNYFAYYGAELDPFADRTGRTTLRGASGVFGAALTVYAVQVTVLADASFGVVAPHAMP